ncbi:MAG: aminotransferase class V-fold PLP-dependent enzyme [Dehalococcoidia bacterium]|nr:aminotransferase class V-fold PLP-dependent enzyme [Dehalococcoidia bacterium]
MDFGSLREEMPTVSRMIYLNSGWSGPSPKRVIDAVTQRLVYENEEGPTSRPVLDSRTAIKNGARTAFAELMGASAEEIVLTDNTTDGINIVVNGLPWEPGDEIITTSLEHGSGLVPSYYVARRKDAKLKIVELTAEDDSASILSKFASAITPKTRLVLLSHIMFRNGLMLPLKEIQRLAHASGARVLVDGAQSMGHIPLDMVEMECDYYAVPGHKWLLGPDGVGALYIRKELIEGVEPAKVGGAAASSYDTIGNLVPNTQTVRKYELTTQSAPLQAGAVAAIGLFQELGMQNIWERIQLLSGGLTRGLSDIPRVTLTSPAKGGLASGLVSFAMQGRDPRELTEALWSKYRIVARSVNEPAGVRFSVHCFNTEDEMELTVRAVGELAMVE